MADNMAQRQQQIREEVREFAEREILPICRDLDRRDEEFPFEYYRKLAGAGYAGYSMPKEYGGGGYSNLEFITLIEELTYYDPPTGLMTAIPELATYPIFAFGTEEQKKKYVPGCASGEIIPSFVLTERNAGSDAANQQTLAIIEDDHFVINGEKIFIMHGDVCDLAVLFGRIGSKDDKRPRVSAIIVETDTPGWSARTLKNKMGMRLATTGIITLKDVRVPLENQLGDTGKGFRIAMNTLDGARIGVAAQAVGISRRAIDESVKFYNSRVAAGESSAKLQEIQHTIGEMATQTEAARLMAYRAAQRQDGGESYTVEAAQAKMFTTEVAKFCVDRAVRIHSGQGVLGEFSVVEQLYRDQRITEIYEGTNEVQRLVIANSFLR
ncbi:MAG: acyl-CoA dehydrogenase family protein [Candidatus Zixiibacteriota bacterium]|nr:MAG: acyl-CoA dehydrogenase family protein [candidate division Zixibacteria bacterium]